MSQLLSYLLFSCSHIDSSGLMSMSSMAKIKKLKPAVWLKSMDFSLCVALGRLMKFKWSRKMSHSQTLIHWEWLSCSAPLELVKGKEDVSPTLNCNENTSHCVAVPFMTNDAVVLVFSMPALPLVWSCLIAKDVIKTVICNKTDKMSPSHLHNGI